jgi:Methyltransferase domain
MNALVKMGKAVLPARLRGVLRAQHRKLVFRRAMRRYLRDPEAAIAPGSTVMSDLVYGWGNDFWSALEEYLVACVGAAMHADGPILECGSGLTSIVVGAIAQRTGNTMWSLEHNPEWSRRVQDRLTRYRIDAVHLLTAPLKDHSDFTWYDAPLDRMPDGFALVVCDGPPGMTRGGRYGLAPVMRDRLKPGCIILLDDAGRREERAIAERWGAELGASYELLGDRKPYVRMTLLNKRLDAAGRRLRAEEIAARRAVSHSPTPGDRL